MNGPALVSGPVDSSGHPCHVSLAHIEKRITWKAGTWKREKRTTPQNLKPDEWAWLDAIERPVDEDFLKAASEKPEEQRREGLEDLFAYLRLIPFANCADLSTA